MCGKLNKKNWQCVTIMLGWMEIEFQSANNLKLKEVGDRGFHSGKNKSENVSLRLFFLCTRGSLVLGAEQ